MVAIAMRMSLQALFLASSQTAGIRSLGVNHLHLRLRETLPRYEIRTSYDPHTNLATIRVRLSAWWWLTLGLAHTWVWLRARRPVLQSLDMVKADIRTKVLWPRSRL